VVANEGGRGGRRGRERGREGEKEGREGGRGGGEDEEGRVSRGREAIREIE
jgi:hypothetical protein